MPLPPALAPHLLAEAGATPVGARIAILAAENELFFSHFEHHVQLELPEAWEPIGRPDLGEIAPWQRGVLPETKFRHFRLDRMVGSFHPGQRNKWTAHELAHRLCGYALWPGMSRLEIAVMARVAEAFPVALWYFFDEAGRARCSSHAESDAFGAGWCPACEAAALTGPAPDERAAARIADGWRFLERELAAAEESLHLGRPVATPWRSIDLMSDGLAWSAAHAARLQSPETLFWAARFGGPAAGGFTELPAFLARVRAVAEAAVNGAPLPAWSARDWALGDLAARICQVAALVEGECAEALLASLDTAATHRSLPRLAADYAAIEEDYELPPRAEVLAVGYETAAGGLSEAQIADGLASFCTLPASAAGAVSARESWSRTPLARRALAGFPEAPLLPLQAALADPPPANLAALTLAADVEEGAPLTLGAVELVQAPAGWPVLLEGRKSRKTGQVTVAVLRDASGAPMAIELSPAAAEVAARMAVAPQSCAALDPEERENLVAAGVFVGPSR